jgi:cytochrome c oxidase assembly protein subunit 11
MVGVSYASVPLYRAFCQATGYGGAVGPAARDVESKVAARAAAVASGDARALSLEQRAAQRELRVWLEADVDDDLPWKFTPATPSVAVRPGQSALAFFTAENLSEDAITGVSTYNVVPDRAAYYFNKIQCFCFEQQRLRGKEKVDMPVLFYLDPEMVDDFNCRNVHDVTLSYTFYRVEDGEDVEGEGGGGKGGGVRLHGPDGPGTPVPAEAAAMAARAVR